MEPADPAREQRSEGAEVRHLPVPFGEDQPTVYATEARPIEPRPDVPAPVLAAAAGGFIAGVAAWVLVRILRRPRGAVRVSRRRRRGEKGLDVASTRSFLVDVHLLRDR